MFKQIAIAAALATSASAGFAGTVIGGATLLDTATVINNTVSPTTFLTYVSGGDGTTGDADGTNFNYLALTGAQAMNTANHQWLQFDAPILMHSNTALTDVIAIPAIDHGWSRGQRGTRVLGVVRVHRLGLRRHGLRRYGVRGRPHHEGLDARRRQRWRGEERRRLDHAVALRLGLQQLLHHVRRSSRPRQRHARRVLGR